MFPDRIWHPLDASVSVLTCVRTPSVLPSSIGILRKESWSTGYVLIGIVVADVPGNTACTSPATSLCKVEKDLMRLGIRAKLFAGFGAVLLLLCVVGGVAFWSLAQATEATHEIANTE